MRTAASAAMGRNKFRGGPNPVGGQRQREDKPRRCRSTGLGAIAGAGDPTTGQQGTGQRQALLGAEQHQWKCHEDRLSERGVMVFEECCQLGHSRWIVIRGRRTC